MDCTYSFTFSGLMGFCYGADVARLSWTMLDFDGNYTVKYSIRGDSLYGRLIEQKISSYNSFADEYFSYGDNDSLVQVDVYVSNPHQGIRGTWKYVTSYHESPNIYVNPMMDNVMNFMTIGDDSFLMEEVANKNYTFAQSMLVQNILMDIYNNDENAYVSSPVYAAYRSYMYPYENPVVDIRLVSEGKDKVVFKVNGKDLVFSDISSDVNYFYKNATKFDLEYNGKKCSFNEGYERISEKTCKAENEERLEISRIYDDYGEEVIGVTAYHYLYPSTRSEFNSCFREMIGLPKWDY